MEATQTRKVNRLRKGHTFLCPRDGHAEKVLFNRGDNAGFRFIRTNRHDHTFRSTADVEIAKEI